MGPKLVRNFGQEVEEAIRQAEEDDNDAIAEANEYLDELDMTEFDWEKYLPEDAD